MNFEAWLTQWLRQHPVKQPNATEADRFTQQVMQRVRETEARPVVRASQAPAFSFWPRLALAGAGALCAILLALHLRPAMTPSQVALIAPEAQETRVVLAESPKQDDADWVEQSMQMLNELDEDPALQAEDQDSQWLDDLESADEADLATHS